MKLEGLSISLYSMCTKVCRSVPVTYLHQKPILDWCVVRWGSKKTHIIKTHIWKRWDYVFKFSNYSMLNSERNWKDLYIQIKKSINLNQGRSDFCWCFIVCWCSTWASVPTLHEHFRVDLSTLKSALSSSTIPKRMWAFREYSSKLDKYIWVVYWQLNFVVYSMFSSTHNWKGQCDPFLLLLHLNSIPESQHDNLHDSMQLLNGCANSGSDPKMDMNMGLYLTRIQFHLEDEA